MKTMLFKRATVLMLAAMIVSPTTLLADDKKPTPGQEPAQASTEAGVGAPKGKLSDDENPLMIGKRNINAHQINFYSLNKEVALGRQLAADVDRQGKFIEDPVVTEFVNRVGQNIALHSDAKIPFTIKVLDSDDVNAFALPGGFLYVNKGAILAADTESELAGVMAHEIGHVAARHGVEQASKATLANYAMIPLIFMTGGLGYIAYQAAQIGVPLTFLKFSRNVESEADKLGAQYMWAAGYDPNNFLSFFEKLEKKEKHKPGTLSKLFGTHPPTPDRIVKVHDLLARFPDRDEYTVSTSEFNRVKSRLLAITNSKTLDASGRESGPKRPTLKRRKEGEDPSQPSTTGEDQPKDKPTLKRRDSDGKPADTKPPETTPPDQQ
ncbi:MAG TPA: M48 family metallopeptidase [Blastocatellia bacterium]|nr:M48 family metallopeptidase [Blastocatellia bacterium]